MAVILAIEYAPKVVETRSSSPIPTFNQMDSLQLWTSTNQAKDGMDRVRPEAEDVRERVEGGLKKDAVLSQLIQSNLSLYLLIFVDFIRITCL